MDSSDEALDEILERALISQAIMGELSAPPYSFSYDGPSGGTVLGMIQGVDAQVILLASAEASTTEAATAWDVDLETLVLDARLGTRLGRLKYEGTPVKQRLFEALTYPTTGRDGKFKQAVAFEAAWKKTDPLWTFKPGLSLGNYTARRLNISNVRIINHANAVVDESGERVVLHELANALNAVCVNWYDAATAVFARDTPGGQLLSTVPTTYDPNRPPGQLKFTAHFSTAPNTAHLRWKAPRGTKFYISGKGPGQSAFEMMFDGVPEKEWMGLAVNAGLWSFKGYATNEHGEGAESDIVQIEVMAAAAA